MIKNPRFRFLPAAVAACAVLLVGCSSGPRRLILGQWEVENGPTKLVAEFKNDGTASLSMLGQTVRGRYRLTDAGELEWSMSGMTMKAKVKVTPTELELTGDQNLTIKYKRK